MIILNETVQVEDQAHDRWVTWLHEQHIPAMMATGIFTTYKVCQLLGINREGDAVTTYAVQYTAPDMQSLHTYQVQYAAEFSSAMTKAFGETALAFRTLLRVLEEGSVENVE